VFLASAVTIHVLNRIESGASVVEELGTGTQVTAPPAGEAPPATTPTGN